jgi:NAD(P)-dependent dehydrogenase (short-subunit alcohol dehydrogenase family)
MLMKGKTVVVTGATSGIGEVAAERLAAMGARIVMVARNTAKAEAVLAKLREVAPAQAHRAHLADLSSIADCWRLAQEIAGKESRIEVLVNNAGALFGSRETTVDGLEQTFATNHMAYFVLTMGLLGPLLASDSPRVVSTASRMHLGQSLNFDDLQMERSFNGVQAYGRSKLCNILFTRELARRYAERGLIANCLHPGYVATRFGDDSGPMISLLNRIGKLMAISPEKGAETIIYLASSPEAAKVNGQYFHVCKAIKPSRQGRDDVMASRLWEVSERLLQSKAALAA